MTMNPSKEVINHRNAVSPKKQDYAIECPRKLEMNLFLLFTLRKQRKFLGKHFFSGMQEFIQLGQ